MTDWPDDPDTRDFLRRAESEMAPKLAGSTVSLNIVPDGKGDPKFWVELGAAIMYEKPILLLVIEGRSIPQKLQRVADEIIVAPDGDWPDSVGREIEAAMRRIHGD